jgi:hypothetical protein
MARPVGTDRTSWIEKFRLSILNRRRFVMPGPGSSPRQALVPGIHDATVRQESMDGQDRPGHDE